MFKIPFLTFHQMDIKSKFKTLRITFRDNGLIGGGNLSLFFLLQKYLKIPREHIYTYHIKSFGKNAKIVGTTYTGYPWTFIDIFGYKPYLESQNSKIKFNLTSESNVIDIGAFIGDSAIFFAIQGAKVYAFEPQKNAYDLLLRNIQINNLKKKIIPTDTAVTNDGRNLFFSQPEIINGMFSIKNNGKNQKLEKSISLKEILRKERRYDLLKIDAEGSEYELVQYFLDNPSELGKIESFIIEFEHTDKPENKSKISSFIKLLERKKYQMDYKFGKTGYCLGMFYAKRLPD